MAIENDPSARMVMRSRGDMVHPGCCMVCGSGTHDGGFLDLGVYFDYEGTMYLCLTCATQAGETAGLYTPDQIMVIQKLAESLAEENVSLKMELENARIYIDSLNSVLHSEFRPNNDVVSSPAQEPRTKRKAAGKPAGDTDSGEPAFEESITFAGPANIGGAKLRNIAFE